MFVDKQKHISHTAPGSHHLVTGSWPSLVMGSCTIMDTGYGASSLAELECAVLGFVDVSQMYLNV